MWGATAPCTHCSTLKVGSHTFAGPCTHQTIVFADCVILTVSIRDTSCDGEDDAMAEEHILTEDEDEDEEDLFLTCRLAGRCMQQVGRVYPSATHCTYYLADLLRVGLQRHSLVLETY
jgi:hypothetical protein